MKRNHYPIFYLLLLLLINSCFYSVNLQIKTDYLPYKIVKDNFLRSSFKYHISISKPLSGHIAKSSFYGVILPSSDYTAKGYIDMGFGKESINIVKKNDNAYYFKEGKWEKVDIRDIIPVNDYIKWFIPEKAEYIGTYKHNDYYISKVFVPVFMGINTDSLIDTVIVNNGFIREIKVHGANGLNVNVLFEKGNYDIKPPIKTVFYLYATATDHIMNDFVRETLKRMLKSRLSKCGYEVNNIYFEGDDVFITLRGDDISEDFIKQVIKRGIRGIYEIEWMEADSAGKYTYEMDVRVFDDAYSHKYKGIMVDSVGCPLIKDVKIKRSSLGMSQCTIHINKFSLEDTIRWGFAVDGIIYDSNRSSRIDSIVIKGDIPYNEMKGIGYLLNFQPMPVGFRLNRIESE